MHNTESKRISQLGTKLKIDHIPNQEPEYLPKMEEPHITICRESLQRSKCQLPAHNSASKPPAPCSTDSPQSPKTSALQIISSKKSKNQSQIHQNPLKNLFPKAPITSIQSERQIVS